MKTPPFLIGAAVVFWGWQTDLLPVSIIMAAVLEAARFTQSRWEFSNEDFSRIWTICTLLFLGIAVYAFTDNGGPARFGNLLQNPGPATQSSAGAATSRTASTMLRWLPMVLFLFVAAQFYSTREKVPLSTISLILRRRWQKAAKLGKPLPHDRGLNVSYPYFAVCLFAASVHASDDNSYFWGFCLLMGWALWIQRVRRFAVPIWAVVLLFVFAGGFMGQSGVGRLQNYIQNMDPQWFERFVRRQGTDPAQSKTQIGRIGSLKMSGRIVVRLEPEAGSVAPDYLREASYRIYGGSAWRAGQSRENFQVVPQETNNGAYVLVGKPTLNSVKIASYLDGFSRESGVPVGLLPLPTGVGQLEQLPAFVIKMNNLGAVLAEGPGLITYRARYGAGPTADSPFDPTEMQSLTNSRSRNRSSSREDRPRRERVGNPDLYVPAGEVSALQQVIDEHALPPGNRQAAMRAIQEFFDKNFKYSTWLDTPASRSTNNTPLGLFLMETRSGHCEYFATATVLLLRQLGIPARYAVGYAVHEQSGSEYVVRLRDAHAWCLVWNERSRTWQDFDTTPASWVEEEAKNASTFQGVSDLWNWLGFQFAKFRWGQSNARQYMLLALVPATGLLAYQIFRRRRKGAGSRETGRAVIWPGVDSEFYVVEKKLTDHGMGRRQNEPLAAWLERVIAAKHLETARAPLRELLRLHYRYRFDPSGLPAAERARLRDVVETILQQLAQVEANFQRGA